MERVTIDREGWRIIIKSDNSPEDVLRIKTLPGRWYDGEHAVWIVPVRPGLAAKVEAIFKDPATAAMIETMEEDFLRRIQRRPISLTEAFAMPIEEAAAIARTNHFYIEHHGDERDFIRHHGRLEGE